MRPDQSQPQAFTRPAQQFPGRIACPRQPGCRAGEVDQEHAVNGIFRIFRRHVLEIGPHHCRTCPADAPAPDDTVLDEPVVLGLDPRPVRVALAMADMDMSRPALTTGRVLAQVQVDQMQAGQLPDPEPAVAQPGHHHPVPGRVKLLQQSLPGPLWSHLRVASHLPLRPERVGRHLLQHMPEEGPLPVGLGRQPRSVHCLAQALVDPQRRSLEQEEPLQRRGRRVQRALPVRLLALPPRRPERARVLRAHSPHVTAHITERRRLRAEPLMGEPPQMVDDQVRIRPRCARLERPQEPIRRLVHRPVRADDGVPEPAVLPPELLDPHIVDHHPPQAHPAPSR